MISLYLTVLLLVFQCISSSWTIKHPLQSKLLQDKQPFEYLKARNLHALQGHERGTSIDSLLLLRGGSSLLTSNTLSSFSNIATLKLFLQLLITVLNVACWWIPLHSRSIQQDSKLLGYGNTFAGGIFLVLSLGHMIPHAIETLANQRLPIELPFYVALVGFILILFIEKIAFINPEAFKDNNHSVESNSSGRGSMSNKSAIILVLALSLHRSHSHALYHML